MNTKNEIKYFYEIERFKNQIHISMKLHIYIYVL